MVFVYVHATNQDSGKADATKESKLTKTHKGRQVNDGQVQLIRLIRRGGNRTRAGYVKTSQNKQEEIHQNETQNTE